MNRTIRLRSRDTLSDPLDIYSVSYTLVSSVVLCNYSRIVKLCTDEFLSLFVAGMLTISHFTTASA